jgi:hypothetical protein
MMPVPGFEIAAIRTLTANDPVMARVIAGVGPCSLQPDRGADLFQALLRSIVFQQLHGKAATAIHTRVVALMPELTAAAFQELSDASLRAAGLSANKLGALRDLAAKTLEDTIPTVTAAIELSDDALLGTHQRARRGSVDVQMLMIFYLGRRMFCLDRFWDSKSIQPPLPPWSAGNSKPSFAMPSAGNHTGPRQAGICGARSISHLR